jgi:hypothetical protein
MKARRRLIDISERIGHRLTRAAGILQGRTSNLFNARQIWYSHPNSKR